MKKIFRPWLLRAFFVAYILIPTTGNTELLLKYQLLPGENVGTVLERIGQLPLWSEQGSFKKTTLANPILKKKYIDFNLPAYTWINLPVSKLPQSEDYKVQNGILKFSSKKKYGQNSDIKKVMSLVNKEIARGGYSNFRDIVIHYHNDSKRKNNDQPIIINLNFYNGYTDTVERKLASQNVSPKNESDYWPQLKSHEVFLSLGSHSLKIEGESPSSRARIFSDSGTSVSTHWLQQWSDYYSTALFLQATQYGISNNSNISIVDGDNLTLLNYGFKNKFRLLNPLSLEFDISLMDKYFINTTSGNLLLSVESVFAAGLDLGYRIFKWGGHSFNSTVGVQYNFGKSASFAQIDSGFGYDVDLFYNYDLASHQFGAGANYGFMRQNTSLYNQEDTELVLSILYRYSFGGQD